MNDTIEYYEKLLARVPWWNGLLLCYIYLCTFFMADDILHGRSYVRDTLLILWACCEMWILRSNSDNYRHNIATLKKIREGV